MLKFLPLLFTLTAYSAVEFVPVNYYSTYAERVKITRASAKVNEVVKSQCFENFLKNRSMISTNGRTSEQVITHLRGLTGKIPVRMYTRCMYFSWRCLAPTSAVAYRQPPETTINLNRVAFYTSLSDCEWASTMAHEGLGHSLGNYDHTYEWTSMRDFSVPYSLGGSASRNGGDAFTKCCK